MAKKSSSIYGPATGVTITLDALASGAGRVSTEVDAISPGLKLSPAGIRVSASVVTIALAVAGSTVTFFLVTNDGGNPAIRTDGLGAVDAGVAGAAITNAQPIGSLIVPSAGGIATLEDSFDVEDPGGRFSILVQNNTGQALGVGNVVRYQRVDDAMDIR